jgi:hypothetical protein
MLTKDPERRIQSMAEVIQILAPYAPAQRMAAVATVTQRPSARLGAILVSDGLLTPADLERALLEQSRTGQLLGRALVDMGLVSQPDLLVALAKQQGLVPLPPEPATHTLVGQTASRARSRRRHALWAAAFATLGAVAVVTGIAVTRSGSAVTSAGTSSEAARAKTAVAETAASSIALVAGPTLAGPTPAMPAPPASTGPSQPATRGRPAAAGAPASRSAHPEVARFEPQSI